MPLIKKCNAEVILEFQDSIWSAAVPPDPIRFREKFIPQRDLERLLGIREVQMILTHACDVCSQHLEGNRLARTIDAAKISETATLRDLFALLTYIQYPRLIGCFMSQSNIEFCTPQSFSYNDLKDKIFQHLGGDAEQIAEEFCTHMYQFGIPHFTDGGFTEYGKDVILPFLSGKEHARGGYGTVYKIEIHPDYCSLMSSKRPSGQQINATPLPKNVVLARKTINNGDVADFAMEKTNLEKISSLKHPNLISILKTYKHGPTFNILFPFVEINLYDYLRDANSGAPRTTVVSKSPLWKQVLGLTEGLQRIIDFKDKDDPTKLHFGYHLDVKPQNVLVKRNHYGTPDIFLLTDFGQTQIEPADLRGHSKIEVSGGTDAYVPPEYLSGEINRKYDVWSLGIILTEILTFASRGADGVKTLDNIRHTKDERGNGNSRFFHLKSGRPEVKPEIVAWLDGLSDESPSVSGDSQQFVTNVHALIDKMLNTNMDNRIGIDVVLTQMGSIFRIREGSQSERTGLREFLKMEDEIELLDLRGEVKYYLSDMSPPKLAAFKTYEGRAGSLRTHVGFTETSNTRDLTRFIPRFKFRDYVGQRVYDIGFSRTQGPGFLTWKDFFILADQIEAKQIQERLTEQTIKKGFPLTGIVVTPQQNRGTSIKGIFSKPKTHEPQKSITPHWIELWEEESLESLGKSKLEVQRTSTQSAKEARQPRKPGSEKNPNTRRVVIYCTDKIITIRFAAGFMLRPKPNEVKEKETCMLIFELADVVNCPSFSIHHLQPMNAESFTGIPMSRQTLFSVEDADTIKCRTLTLTFPSWQVANSFSEAYREMKIAWMKEENALAAKHEI